MFDYYLDLSSANSGVVLVGEKVIYITSWNFSKFKKKSKIKVEWQILRFVQNGITAFCNNDKDGDNRYYYIGYDWCGQYNSDGSSRLGR